MSRSRLTTLRPKKSWQRVFRLRIGSRHMRGSSEAIAPCRNGALCNGTLDVEQEQNSRQQVWISNAFEICDRRDYTI
jgi:hypothetical protein